jgi:hypothetical protein
VFPTGSPAEHAWKHDTIKHFMCQECPEGEVPFVEGSNLELVWDGATWTVRLIDNGSSRIRGVQHTIVQIAGPAEAAAANAAAAATTTAAADRSMPATPQQAVLTTEGTAGLLSGEGWYDRAYPAYSQGADISQPPYFLGQCVPCPEGSFQDGLRCKCTATAV